ncbi:MAG: S8 family serine peptidase, partial [Verrucomicrobiae bacterium]|nr:S8 family serine peptidase [Verrucomicrobiae bacterium]
MLRSVLLASLLLALDVWAAPPRFRQDRVLARPRAEAGVRQANAIAAAHAALGARVHRQYARFGNLQVLQLPKGLPPERAIERLRATGLFEYVEPDYTLRALLMPNDPRFTDGSLWGLHNTGQSGGTADADIDAPEAWDIRTEAGDVIVAVIDSGIDYTHPDLAANMWTNPCVGCPVNGIVYSNDVHGINAITGSGNPLDDHFHGTHVAGTIGALGNNGLGVAGVAWKVRLMALKFLGSDGQGDTSDAIECINYAIAKGAHILNNSWGGGAYSQALADAIAAARAAGIIFVAAAGNNGEDNDFTPMYPASYPYDNVLAVAATDRRDRLGSFSNYGYNGVALAAPGVAIWSTMPTYTTTPMSNNNYPTGYHSINGTSMAAPHVAGTLALLRAQFPGDSYAQLIQRLLGNVDLLPQLADAAKSGGRLNAHRALTQPPGPIVRFQIQPWRQTLLNPLRFTGGSPPLSVVCSNDTIGAISQVWDFGDGSPPSTQFHASHVYSNSGIYQITLTATAANGQTRTASRQVVVDQNYLMRTNVPFVWINDAAHTPLSLSDQSFVSYALPFVFSFYGNPQTNVFIGSNGQLAFSTNGLPSWNGYPPDPDPPNNILCVLCADLNPAFSGGSVRVGVVGSAPHRIFVVTWRNVKSSGFDGRFTFQALLFESTHDIKFQYLDPASQGDPQISGGGSSVVGLEHPTGYIAQLFRDATDGPRLRPGQAIYFTRQPLALIETRFTVLNGNNNDSLDPGETVGEQLVLRNEMNLTASGVTAVLVTTGTNITILNGNDAYPDLPPFGTATNLNHFVYRIGRDVPAGTVLEFDLITTVASTGSTYTNRFWRRVGRPGYSVTNLVDSADLNVPIPEYPGVLYSTAIVGLPPGHIVEDLNVSLRASHQYASQLKFTIRSPSGTELVLADGAWTPATATDYGTGVCGQGELRTVFDSEATNTFENTPLPYIVPMRPQYSTLTIYNGQPAPGTWTLKVEDRWSPFTGTLNCWGLRIVSRDTNYVAEVFRDCESNTVPVATSLSVTGVANVALPIVLAGSDADGDPLSYLTNSPPLSGYLSGFNPATGSILYNPAPGFIGTDSFDFAVSDGCATSTVATVSITIQPNSTNFWSGAVSGDWGTGSNWINGTVPPPGSAVLFPNAVTQVVSSSVDRVVSDLLFSASGAYTLAGGYKITLSSSLQQNGAGPVTINSSLTWNGPITLGGTGAGEVTLPALLTGSNTLTVNGGNWTLNADNSGTLTSGTKWLLNGGRLSLGNVNRLGYHPAAPVHDYLTLNGGALRATAALGNLANRGLTVSTNGGVLDANTQTPALTFNTPDTLRGPGQLVLRNGGRVDLTAAQPNFTGTLRLGNGSGTGNSLTAVRLNDSTFTFNGHFIIDDPAANGPTPIANFSSIPSTVTLGGAITFAGQVFRQPHIFLSRYNGTLLNIGLTAVLSGASAGDA